MVDLQQSDYMRNLEVAIQFGLPALLQNVHEFLDPSLDPILNKAIVKIGTRHSLYHPSLDINRIQYNRAVVFV